MVDEYREKGNKILIEYKKKNFTDKDFCEQELLNAINFYEQGLKLCDKKSSYYDKYKLFKNITLAYEILINYNLSKHSDIFFIKHNRYTKQIFFYYSNLLNHIYHLEENIYNDIISKIRNSSKYFIEFKDEDKLGLINEIIEPFKKYKNLYYFFASEVCKKYLHKGLEYYNQKNELKAINNFYNAIEYYKQNNVKGEFQFLNDNDFEDLNSTLLSCSFYIKRIKTKKLLDSAIKNLDEGVYQSET
jgi:hypothetical protein